MNPYANDPSIEAVFEENGNGWRIVRCTHQPWFGPLCNRCQDKNEETLQAAIDTEESEHANQTQATRKRRKYHREPKFATTDLVCGHASTRPYYAKQLCQP